MEKVPFVYNPRSGDHSFKNNLDYLFERFQSSGVLLVPFRLFQDEDFVPSLTALFKMGSIPFAIVSGGDGTVNYMLNFFMKNGITIPMGIYPGGTCNDFARSIGMSGNIDEWINIMHSKKIRCIDTGLINSHHYFLGNLCGGMFSNVSLHAGNDLKKKIGIVAYYLKALETLPKIETFNLTVETENSTIHEDIILFLVANSRNVAGFSDFFKDADLEDGNIDIILFRKAKPMELVNLFFKIMSKELPGDNRIIHLRAKDCKIQSDKQVQISVDGEMGTLLPIHVQCVHHSIRIILN